MSSFKISNLKTATLRRRVIWNKNIDAHSKTFFGMRVFLRAVGLGND